MKLKLSIIALISIFSLLSCHKAIANENNVFPDVSTGKAELPISKAVLPGLPITEFAKIGRVTQASKCVDTPDRTESKGLWERGYLVSIQGIVSSNNQDWYLIKTTQHECFIKANNVDLVEATLPQQQRPASIPIPIYTRSTGQCGTPSDIDSIGRRCGNRAASVRRGGKLRRYR